MLWVTTTYQYSTCSLIRHASPTSDAASSLASGVASSWCTKETKRKYFKSDTKILSYSNCGAHVHSHPLYRTDFYCIWNYKLHNVKSLCGSEVTWKIKQLEVEGARAPLPHNWRCPYHCCNVITYLWRHFLIANTDRLPRPVQMLLVPIMFLLLLLLYLQLWIRLY